MKPLILIPLVILITSSCSGLQQLNKLQYDLSFTRSESKNFAGAKAKTQWWYFDCFLEDGSLIVFFINPHQWWSQTQKSDSTKSLLYFSYMNPQGKVTSGGQIFDFSQLVYDENSLRCPYFELTRSPTAKGRNYIMDFKLPQIKGSLTISSSSKVFSPLPTSSMGKLATRHILKLKGADLAFRYGAYVPQGEVYCHLEINGKNIRQSGKAYHEQGWFSGEPSQLGIGWTWFHFVSKTINVFGKVGDFICLERNDKRVLGGINYKLLTLTNKGYVDQYDRLLMRGRITLKDGRTAFSIHPTRKKTTPLLYLPSFESEQLWGSVAQPSTITLQINGKAVMEEGTLILETCYLKKGLTNDNNLQASP